MKKKDLLKIIKSHGCSFVRNGANHDIYSDAKGTKKVPIPRHRKINEFTAKQILKQLGIKL